MERIEVAAPLRIWQSTAASAAWGHIIITGEPADEIRIAAMTGQWLDGGKRGFGSARVTVTIGETRWQTSVFPVKESGGWFLPIKLAVRRAEGLLEGEMVRATIML